MEDQEAILFQLVTALQEGLGERLVAVVLYGSRARDQACEASDWDLFIPRRREDPFLQVGDERRLHLGFSAVRCTA